jgi:hypothetical protein
MPKITFERRLVFEVRAYTKDTETLILNINWLKNRQRSVQKSKITLKLKNFFMHVFIYINQ